MRNVLVSGASRGLGLAIAEALAASGHRVIAAARGEGAVPALRDRVRAAGTGEVVFEPVDLAELDRLGPWVKDLAARHGAFYGLVNNAAAAASGMLAMASDEQTERVVRLNVLSPMLLTKYVVRSIMTRPGAGGRIVNIASIVAATGYPGLSVYSATKASLVGFTRSLARELGPLGVTVNAVSPGFVATEMTGALDEADRARIARRSALRRAPEAVDVASAVDFLFGDRARNVTGTVMTVDAGNTA